MIVSPSVRLASDVCLSATPLKITRKRRNVCKSILNLSIYVSCIWSMCAPAWCVPHRPDKCTKLKILLLNGSLAEKRSSPKWWMMPWHSLALTHTNSHSNRLTHAYMTPQSTGRWMKWLSDILCCPAKGLLKFSRREVCRIPATDSDCQLPVWRRALKTFPYLAGGTWQARLPCGNIRWAWVGWRRKLQKLNIIFIIAFIT